jgi:flagellar biosynthetic protein FliR
MPVNLTLSAGTLFGFALVLARVGGALVFVPLPGVKGAPEPVRAAFALAFTLALFSRWPVMDASAVTVGRLAAWATAESAVGLAIGVSIGVALEAFGLAAQLLGLQAGYSFASTVDPNTEADSGILVVLAQLIAGMMFFAVGLDRQVLRLFAYSLDTIPAGAYHFAGYSARPLIGLGSALFSVGVRLALPVVALLVMLDVALALLGRLNQQLQLLHMAFPAKMLTALVALGWLAPLFPRILLGLGGQAWTAARQMLGI